MAYNTKALVTDVSTKNPAPQYYNPTTDSYEVAQGSGGAIDVNVKSSSTLKGALQTVTTAGTRVQLPNYPCREVTLIAKKGNTGSIYVGGNDVSSTVFGAELTAKDSVTLAVSNTNLIYIDASVSGEGISYVAI